MTDIALVVLDTLRKDRFDEHFDWLPGRRFENAYSTANWTVPAHASLFTGKYGTEVGLHAHSREMECPEETVPHELGEAGHETIDGFVPADDSAEFQRAIDSLQEELVERDVRSSEDELTEETRERLKDLGYA